MMIKFFGRSYFKVFMKDKPVRFGFKLWSLNDPSTGYFYRIKPYAGKAPGEAPVQGLGTKVVIDMAT